MKFYFLFFIFLYIELFACVSNGLKIHYEFEDNVLDSSGNGYHANSHGVINYSADSIEGKSVKFDGINDWIDTTFYVKPHVGSISVWLKLDSDNVSESIIDASLACQTFTFNVIGQTIVNYVKEDTCGTLEGQKLSSTTVVDTTLWNHYIFIWGEKGKKIYVNGELLSSNSNSEFSRNLQAIFLGKKALYDDSYYKGRMDEFRLYDREILEREILELYNFRNGFCYKTYTQEELELAIKSAKEECLIDPLSCGVNVGTVWESVTEYKKITNDILGQQFDIKGYYLNYGSDSFDWIYVDRVTKKFYKVEEGCSLNGNLRWNHIAYEKDINISIENGTIEF